jgi:hypothetical protein
LTFITQSYLLVLSLISYPNKPYFDDSTDVYLLSIRFSITSKILMLFFVNFLKNVKYFSVFCSPQVFGFNWTKLNVRRVERNFFLLWFIFSTEKFYFWTCASLLLNIFGVSRMCLCECFSKSDIFYGIFVALLYVVAWTFQIEC